MNENYPEILRYKNELDKCVTCGICHTVCPTYNLSHRELFSPRGRIVLLRQLLADKITAEEISLDAFDFCTLCYACQTVCPAGVKTDSVFIVARDLLATVNGSDPRKKKIIELLEKPKTVDSLVTVGAKVQGVIGKTGVEWFTRGLTVPMLRKKPTLRELPDHISPEHTPAKARVGFFIGCVSNYVDDAPARAVLEVLKRLGAEIIIPKAQVCCGAPAFNNGDFDTARRLARINLKMLVEADVDYIVSPDATCGGAFRHEIPMLLEEDAEFAEISNMVAKKTKDWTSLVLDVFDPQFPNAQDSPITITIHDSCHLAHTERTQDNVRLLLSRLPGVTIREMKESAVCCGFGGSFSSLYPAEATEWTERKIRNILETNVETVIAGSPGCIMQIKNAETTGNDPIRYLHPAEFIAERCRWL